MFANVDGIYVQPTDSLNPSSNGLRLGLDNISERRIEGYQHVAIIGRVQDCETVRNGVHASEAPGEIVMISGFCHYANGPYLWVYSLRTERGPRIERRLENLGRNDYGDLVPAPDDWPHRARVEALVKEFLQALQTQNRDRLAGLHFRDVGIERDPEEQRLLDFLLSSRQSTFASLRDGPIAPEHILLVDRSDASSYDATVCFCRERSCTGRWPIASFDADNLPGRPYACTKIGPYLVDGHEIPHFETPMEKYGLDEPLVR